MRLWRITGARYAALDGEGARRYGSRWTPKGLPAVFASTTLALAVLECFVHVDPDLEPDDLVTIAIDVPEDFLAVSLVESHLSANWRMYPPPPELTLFGERWWREAKAAVMLVPSAVVPTERNAIINPTHADFPKLVVGKPETFSFDPRMWKKAPAS